MLIRSIPAFTPLKEVRIMSTQDIGGWLRHAREARGLTVEAIAAQTKISPRHIEALERGAPLALPAFYQRAELRAVARAVGVDEQLAVARLEAELAPVEPLPPVPSTPARIRSEYGLAIVAIGVLLVVLAGWGSFERTAAKGSVLAVQTVGPVAARPVAELPGEVAGAPTTAETVPAAAPVSVGPAELAIRTEPEGARVTVNGIGWGQSPVTLRHLEPGEKRIRVTMDGYAATERSVTVDAGHRKTVHVRLSSVG